jgi:hypothetical protein
VTITPERFQAKWRPVLGVRVTATNSTQVHEHIFRTGLNYHFNSPVVAKY